MSWHTRLASRSWCSRTCQLDFRLKGPPCGDSDWEASCFPPYNLSSKCLYLSCGRNSTFAEVGLWSVDEDEQPWNQTCILQSGKTAEGKAGLLTCMKGRCLKPCGLDSCVCSYSDLTGIVRECCWKRPWHGLWEAITLTVKIQQVLKPRSLEFILHAGSWNQEVVQWFRNTFLELFFHALGGE